MPPAPAAPERAPAIVTLFGAVAKGGLGLRWRMVEPGMRTGDAKGEPGLFRKVFTRCRADRGQMRTAVIATIPSGTAAPAAWDSATLSIPFSIMREYHWFLLGGSGHEPNESDHSPHLNEEQSRYCWIIFELAYGPAWLAGDNLEI